MDEDVARTLGELERKLLELERTLNAIGDDGAPSAPARPSTAAPGPGAGRLVDEAVEAAQAPAAAPPTALEPSPAAGA